LENATKLCLSTADALDKAQTEFDSSFRACYLLSVMHSAAALTITLPLFLAGQSAPPAPHFEVASVKANVSDAPPKSNFPLGPGDAYIRNGGLFSATGFPLATYIAFAYKIAGNQGQYLLPQLPEWAKTERFDIQARGVGDPDKDQMRLMMRALLAERFNLRFSYEKREVPVLALTLAKTGKTGPQLHSHSNQPDCPKEQPSVATLAVANGMPLICNAILRLPPSTPGSVHIGGRNVTITLIADNLSARTNLGRPMIDQTGLAGTFDFTLEWVPDSSDPSQSTDAAPAPAGPSFEQALRQQLGIKLKSQRSQLSIPLVDHVERPSAN